MCATIETKAMKAELKRLALETASDAASDPMAMGMGAAAGMPGIPAVFSPEEYLGSYDEMSFLERFALVQAGLMSAECNRGTTLLLTLCAAPLVCFFFIIVTVINISLIPPIVLFVQTVVKLVLVSQALAPTG